MREHHLDHQHAASLADGTDLGPGCGGSAISDGGQRLGYRETRSYGWPEQLTAPRELLLADTVGEEAIMPDALEATGEYMEQESPDELDGIEGQQPLAIPMGIVFPSKGHPPVLQREQATIRD